MGKIMRNGKKYSGASSSMAENIVYDNTESGLEANDVQGAVDELSEQVSEQNEKIGTVYYRGKILSNVTASGSEENIAFKNYYGGNDPYFQENDDGTITYIGDRTLVLLINYSVYFYQGTTGKLIELKMYRDGAQFGASQSVVNSNYTNFSATSAVYVSKGHTLKFTLKTNAGDVISSNISLTSLVILGLIETS